MSTANPSPALQADLDLAAQLVTEAGKLALTMRQGVLVVDQKTSISDVVSDADKAAEAMIVDRLAELRPDDGLIGEEGAAREGRRKWIIDPVDGTYNFVSGLPEWCSALALVDGDELLLGAVYQATTDELWLGGPGIPTTLNGAPVAPLVDASLHEISISTYLHPARLSRPELIGPLLRSIAGSASLRMLGSGSVELAAIAGSRLGVWVHADTLSWDWFPGAALVQGAGGVTDVFEAQGVRWHLAGPATAVGEVKGLLLA
ncbi:inositol monophosphatase family protein [Nakamurella deserti]|uniref:inositol monophosphatase family protein n=1 Tax=Nakamurella deserti TaxID=2164074 RepID=UPI000DBE0A88|nr:inositol monophosphatase family protein [Nakamurella deserti]